MATTIQITSYKFYKAGSDEAGQLVGHSGGNRVLRCTFTAPAEGASALAFAKRRVGDESGAIAAGATLRWYVTTDPDSHKNAGADSDYHGEISFTDKDVLEYTAKGASDNLVLLPGETYYLFIFPGTDIKGEYYGWYSITSEPLVLTLSGAAGLVYIGSAVSNTKALLSIYTGGAWKFAIPYIYEGSMWKICS